MEEDEEQQVPGGWEMRVSENGKVYFVDHNTRHTQWTHPNTGEM